MFTPTAAFSGFSVSDLDKAKEFYGTVLGFELADSVGGTTIMLPNGAQAWMYPKADHAPAGYTMLDFVVDDIDAAFDALTERGISFIIYEGSYQDAKGIMRGKDVDRGPNIAWFNDPAGNVLAILEK